MFVAPDSDEARVMYILDCINSVFEYQQEDFDFYVTTHNYFRSDCFRLWIKAGSELDNKGDTRFSRITYNAHAISHPRKTDENWSDYSRYVDF